MIKISIFEDFAISSTVSFTFLKLETSTTLYERFKLSTALTAFFNSSSSISQIITFAPAGVTAFTAIFLSASSLPKDLVKPIAPALAEL